MCISREPQLICLNEWSSFECRFLVCQSLNGTKAFKFIVLKCQGQSMKKWVSSECRLATLTGVDRPCVPEEMRFSS